jgi:uncharacterized protein YgiM (DUF1202 family)
MSRKLLRSLWLLTGITVVLLLAATIYLAREANVKQEAGYSAYIVGLKGVIYLRQQPNPSSRVVTILELGQRVFVTQSSHESGTPWAKITTGEYEGWVPAERLGETPNAPEI